MENLFTTETQPIRMEAGKLFVFQVAAARMAQALPPGMGLWHPEKRTVLSQDWWVLEW